MKNKFTLLLTISILLTIGTGCGMVERFTGSETPANSQPANKTIGDRAVDVAVGEDKLGIPECDELFDAITAQANSPEDDFATRAAKRVILNKIRESIKRSIAENKNDPAQLGKDCREYKTQLDQLMTEQGSGNQ